MRKNLVAGLVLAVATALVVLVSSTLDLEMESAALLGAALGAVVALVPIRTPWVRIGGFAAGFFAAWIGYGVRAQFLPDSAGGRAVTAGLVVLLCVGITAVSMNKLPLWTTLLGTAAMVGAYEYTYAAAPPEMIATSFSTATALLFSFAVGFLAVAVFAPAGKTEPLRRAKRRVTPTDDDSANRLDDFMMEKAK